MADVSRMPTEEEPILTLPRPVHVRNAARRPRESALLKYTTRTG